MTAPSKACGVCACTFGDTDCVHVTGGRNEEPFGFDPTLSPSADNLFTKSPSGLGMFLPSYISDPPACHIFASVPQTMPHDIEQVLFFNDERYDTDSMHDSEDANATRITFNTSGVYTVTLNVRWYKHGEGDRAIFIWKNFSDFLGVDSLHGGDPDLYLSQSLTVEEYFEAGDFVEAVAKQDCGTKLPITVRRWSPTFAASFVRPEP